MYECREDRAKMTGPPPENRIATKWRDVPEFLETASSDLVKTRV